MVWVPLKLNLTISYLTLEFQRIAHPPYGLPNIYSCSFIGDVAVKLTLLSTLQTDFQINNVPVVIIYHYLQKDSE